MSDILIPVICGPTASGKSATAIALAEEFPIEIVSADSAQVVRYLDIGTAKPSRQQQEIAPTHCIDLIEPGERYSAFRFINDADTAIDSILSRGKLPIVVGGTGLYIKALMHGIVATDKPDPAIRIQLERDARTDGPESLHKRLAELDPESAAEIHPSNLIRVVRALEINIATGMTRRHLLQASVHQKSRFQFVARVLQPHREMLYSWINQRVDRYMDEGFLAEVQALSTNGLAPAVRSSAVIGYSELLDYLDGCATLEQSLNTIRMNTRRYAKRQVTWFKAQQDMDFFVDKMALKVVLLEDLTRLKRALDTRN
ncbi:MAG: tRNA (adenosine(37)-N6)-dimethylallyltransferase MiaA [Candidatus Zixiibacteriota bacterium]